MRIPDPPIDPELALLVHFLDEAYQKKGGRLARDAWRRENVNHFIASLRAMIHSTKPWVRLGISPFGIPSPDTPDFVKGERYHDAYKQTSGTPIPFKVRNPSACLPLYLSPR